MIYGLLILAFVFLAAGFVGLHEKKKRRSPMDANTRTAATIVLTALSGAYQILLAIAVLLYMVALLHRVGLLPFDL